MILQRRGSVFGLVLLIGSLILLASCQKEEGFTSEELKSILMSTGWKLDRLVLHFKDNRPDEEPDTLVVVILTSEDDLQQMNVYTDRWIVFKNDTLGLSAYNLDRYARPDATADWERISKDSKGVGWTDWGSDTRGDLYLHLNKEWPVRIRLINTEQMVLEDAYRLETIEELPSGSVSYTYRITEYPPGILESIDAIYLAAGPDEGPNWFPPWNSWPEGFSYEWYGQGNQLPGWKCL